MNQIVPPLAVTVLNRYDLLRVMLGSLAKGTVQPPRIIVLDNGNRFRAEVRSSGSMPLWERTEVVGTRGVTRSLAASWNEAIKMAQGPAVVISNDDLEWERDTYDVLARGIRYGEPDMATTDNVGGFVCFALTREMVDTVGLFDERFFPAYFEDEDFNYRMNLKGFAQRVVPGCRINHFESGSLRGMTDDQKAIFKGHFQKNVMLYRQKWGGVVREEKYKEPAL